MVSYDSFNLFMLCSNSLFCWIKESQFMHFSGILTCSASIFTSNSGTSLTVLFSCKNSALLFFSALASAFNRSSSSSSSSSFLRLASAASMTFLFRSAHFKS
ncbi:hypothetical protein HanRHA438_Chr09g0379121 [Helianthus annuus]|nr:hypothetical protein HanRHA438_Chr09g0379121 [Helianthus annuus]